MVYWECLKAFEPPGPTKVLGFMDSQYGPDQQPCGHQIMDPVHSCLPGTGRGLQPLYQLFTKHVPGKNDLGSVQSLG